MVYCFHFLWLVGVITFIFALKNNKAIPKWIPAQQSLSFIMERINFKISRNYCYPVTLVLSWDYNVHAGSTDVSGDNQLVDYK